MLRNQNEISKRLFFDNIKMVYFLNFIALLAHFAIMTHFIIPIFLKRKFPAIFWYGFTKVISLSS